MLTAYSLLAACSRQFLAITLSTCLIGVPCCAEFVTRYRQPHRHIPALSLANARRGIIYLHTVRDRINAQRNRFLQRHPARVLHPRRVVRCRNDPDDNHAQRRRDEARSITARG